MADKNLITAVKIFIGLAPGVDIIKLISLINQARVLSLSLI
jgi:hypothetical protein